ncbi:MAG: hypothetical protein SGJ24_04495 [Chloroflexota bacterium]|nr:hypothetical protein [Chloroflexota bacterium]
MVVQVLRSFQHEQRGALLMVHPGDLIEVGRGVGLRLISEGAARGLAPITLTDAEASNVCVMVPTRVLGDRVRAMMPAAWIDVSDSVERLVELLIDEGDADQGVDRVIWWDGSTPLTASMIRDGMAALDTWSAAVPLCDYKILACDVGTVEERKVTAGEIGDLRVPIYETGLMFLRRNSESEALIRQWATSMSLGGDARLAWLRAMWHVKPLLLPLPASWSGARAR